MSTSATRRAAQTAHPGTYKIKIKSAHWCTRTLRHTYHEAVHLAMYVAAKAREVGHHPDIHITWQRVRFAITTHDAGGSITVKDFELARHIDAIAAGHRGRACLDARRVAPTKGASSRVR